MDKIQKGLFEALKKSGVKIPSPKERAENLRRSYIQIYQQVSHVYCPSCCRKEFEKLETNRKYNLRAYEQMTWREILSSSDREYRLSEQETYKFIENNRRSQEEARKVHILVK